MAGSSLLLHKLVMPCHMVFLNSVVVMNLSLPRMWKMFYRTWNESGGSFKDSIKGGTTFLRSVFFSNLSITLVTLVRNCIFCACSF